MPIYMFCAKCGKLIKNYKEGMGCLCKGCKEKMKK
jgi:hypothetical protein